MTYSVSEQLISKALIVNFEKLIEKTLWLTQEKTINLNKLLKTLIFQFYIWMHLLLIFINWLIF